MTINFTEYKNKREKEEAVKYAEIDTHKTFGYISTSIWSAAEVKEMLMHASENDAKYIINEYMNKMLDGEEITFASNDITSVFRIASEEDIKNAEEDVRKADEDLDNFINSEEYDKDLEAFLLDKFGLNN